MRNSKSTAPRYYPNPTCLSLVVALVLVIPALARAVDVDPELSSLLAFVKEQPRTFENEVLFKLDRGAIVRSDHFVGASGILGDFDGDSDVDIYDYNAAQICFSFSGPGLMTPPACDVFDFDGDSDIDLMDLADFLLVYTGSQSALLVEAGGLVPINAPLDFYYSGEPGTNGHNALNGIAGQAGYTQNDLWYDWSILSQPAASGNVVFSNESLPATAYTLLADVLLGQYVFELRVTNLITSEVGIDTASLFISECVEDLDCDDGVFCNGSENCVAGACQAGTTVNCNDNVGCTDDACNESMQSCENLPNDSICDNGLFCDGLESCDPVSDCSPGTDPCAGVDCGIPAPICTEFPGGPTCSCPAPPIFLFTLGQDNLTGTTIDDTFEAPLLFNPPTGQNLVSLQTGDTANGLAGNDTLNATVDGTLTVPTLAGIENINLTAFAPTTVIGTNITGVDTLTTKDSIATLTVNNLQELTDIGLNGITDGASGLTVGFATASTTGSTDDIAVVIEGSSGAGTLTINTGSANGFERCSFTTTGIGQNVLNAVVQGVGTSLARANFSGGGHLQVKTVPNTIRTYDGSSAMGNLMLGAGTSVAGGTNYATFGTMNVTSLKTGSGDDTVIFNNTLDTNDKAIDLGMGTDVVQASIGATISTFLPFTGVEEVRLNATASGVSVNVTNVTGLTDVTNEADGTANTLTINGVAGKPNLNFRGNNTQAAQTYDTLTYVANDATGSSDALAISVNNRGTALNASGTTNVHTVGGGVLTAANFETVNTTVTDGPATFSGMTCAAATAFTFTASSNLTLGTVTGATTAVSSVTASGVTGNLSATFAQVTGTVNLGNGTNTVTVANTSGASVTVSGGTGADTITCNTANIAENLNGNAGADVLDGGDGLDTINGGEGNDTITTDSTTVANADADTVTTGSGVDTIILLSNAASSANSDTISDFTTGASGDQFDLDVSSLESAGASDNIAVDFVELQDGSSVVDTDTVLIHECVTGSGCTPAANANVIVLTGATTATTAALETALEAAGGTVLTIAAAGGDAANAFPVVYSDGNDAFLAICHAEAETTNNTSFDSTDLTCLNLAKMSGNTAIASSEFNAANFDFIP